MAINRRDLLKYFGYIVSITGASCACSHANAQGFYSVGSGPIGCCLPNNPLQGLRTTGQLSQTSGNVGIDKLIIDELKQLRPLFGVQPSFFIYNDAGSPNALASPNTIIPGSQGTVLFGKALMVSEYQSAGLSLDTVIGIIAHEFGHIYEFANGLLNPSAQLELVADYLAGWYIGLKISSGQQLNVQSFAKSLFNKGDYRFNSPNSHGTPAQRVQAMAMGFKLAHENGIKNPAAALNSGRQVIGL